MKFKLVEAMTVVQDRLNPVLWDTNNQLKDEIRSKIIALVNEFKATLDLPLNVLDINIVGSNASYNYTDKSDIDVHIVTNFDQYGYPEALVQAAMNSFKANFNSRYDVNYKGYDVEIYVEDIKSSPQSNGIYSVLNNAWIKEPVKLEPLEVELEPELTWYQNRIKSALESNDVDTVQAIVDDLYVLRRNSLVQEGEFGKGNLVFKQIRNDGLLDALKNKRISLTSRELSVEGLKQTFCSSKGSSSTGLSRNQHNSRSTLKEATLRQALDSVAKQVRDFLARNNVDTATHPVQVFPVYDLGLVKVVFKGTGVSYTIVPEKFPDKPITRKAPVKVTTHYPTAVYRGGMFYDTAGSLIGDAYVSVATSGSKSDYSTELNNLIIKSSDTMVDFKAFVKHIGTDAVSGGRIE